MSREHPHFDGETYEPEHDHARLTKQLDRVRAALIHNAPIWLTLSAIAVITGDPEASISARIRDLRKEKFGAWIVDARRDEQNESLWQYRIRPRVAADREPTRKPGAVARLNQRIHELEAENAALRVKLRGPQQGSLF